tara:strand:+ start:539 stop:1021 length:483 start_codon:yes stop_codon:yes gene_type:complete
MKKLLTTIGLVIVSHNLQAVNNVSWNLVEAIRQVESGGRNVSGDHGMARGQWQFWAIAWKDVSIVRARHKLPTHSYDFAWKEGYARVYAHDYLEILRGRFIKKTRREPSVAELWAVWNTGLGKFFGDHEGDFDKIPLRTKLNAAIIENMLKKMERETNGR